MMHDSWADSKRHPRSGGVGGGSRATERTEPHSLNLHSTKLSYVPTVKWSYNAFFNCIAI